MTPDIERMAREAGFPFNKYGLLQGDDRGEIDADDMLARFAALVAAAERERCAKVCESTGEVAADMYGDGVECLTTASMCAATIRAGVKP